MNEIDITVDHVMIALGQKRVSYYPLFVEGVGSVTGGVLLSQLFYWVSAMDGKTFYKVDAELRKETGLSIKELKSAKSKIKELPFLQIELKGVPAKTFYTFNLRLMATWISQLAQKVPTTKSQKGQQQSPKRDNNKVPKGTTYTENTTEITPETTTNNVPAKKLAGVEKPKKLNWSKESAKVFDLVQEQETRAAGIEVAPFDWHVNEAENFRQLQNLRQTIIRNMNSKRGLPETAAVDFADYAATLELYLTWAWRYYRKQQELTHVLNYTPTSCYRDFNKIKTYASTNKNRACTAASESSPFFQGFGG